MTHRGTYGCNQRERSALALDVLITPLEEGFENPAQHAPRSFVFFPAVPLHCQPWAKSFWKLSGILDFRHIFDMPNKVASSLY
jgi:hypothetical protein